MNTSFYFEQPLCVLVLYLYPGLKCASVCVYVCVWERCAQSNYVFRTEPSGHLCGRPLQSAKDRLVDISSPRLVCVCVWTGNHHFVSSGSLLSFDATNWTNCGETAESWRSVRSPGCRGQMWLTKAPQYHRVCLYF